MTFALTVTVALNPSPWPLKPKPEPEPDGDLLESSAGMEEAGHRPITEKATVRSYARARSDHGEGGAAGPW